MTKIIGLTGGIGSGKSTVLKMFQQVGAAVFIADVEAKKIMNTDEDLKKAIKKLLGEEAYKGDMLNRKFVAQQVFKNTEKLTKLNALIHPKVKSAFLQKSKNTSAEFLIYEAAILFESGSNVYCDFVITVTADKEERIQRVMKRDNVDRNSVLNRMKNQISDEEKIKKSDFVIYNNCLKETKKQVIEIVSKLKKLPKI